MNTDVLNTKNIWAILCTPQSGKAFPEYVEGTRLTDEKGAIHIWDGQELVKSYLAGTWSNFCEWVAVPELHRLEVIRLGDLRPTLPTQRSARPE